MQKFTGTPQKISREQVQKPSSEQLAQVAMDTHNEVCDLARRVKGASPIKDMPFFEDYIVVSLEALAKKLLVVKRIGPNYIPEACSILRDLTEVVVDFFWILSHYEEDPDRAEQLSEQFFLSRDQAFLSQCEFSQEAMKNDLFLRDLYDDVAWNKRTDELREKLEGQTPRNWRRIDGVISRTQAEWDARCCRAAKLVAEMANLKAAPYLDNLKHLSAYTHWDSPQVENYSDEHRNALFDRYLNIAIGFVHDAINGACGLCNLDIPLKIREMRILGKFLYMST